jgi:hypothetical protein
MSHSISTKPGAGIILVDKLGRGIQFDQCHLFFPVILNSVRKEFQTS